MSLDKSLKALKYDVRMIEFYLKSGIVSEAEYNEYLKQLADSSNNSETLAINNDNQSSEDTQH